MYLLHLPTTRIASFFIFPDKSMRLKHLELNLFRLIKSKSPQRDVELNLSLQLLMFLKANQRRKKCSDCKCRANDNDNNGEGPLANDSSWKIIKQIKLFEADCKTGFLISRDRN